MSGHPQKASGSCQKVGILSKSHLTDIVVYCCLCPIYLNPHNCWCMFLSVSLYLLVNDIYIWGNIPISDPRPAMRKELKLWPKPFRGARNWLYSPVSVEEWVFVGLNMGISPISMDFCGLLSLSPMKRTFKYLSWVDIR